MSDSVRGFYNRDDGREWGRLELPLQRIELESTLRLVEEHFPEGGDVCDIGSGPGRYSLELARRGYRVTLLDISKELLGQARDSFRAAGLSAKTIIEGDARDLSKFADGAFDAALVLGPLYHITDTVGRAQALAELRRILKPGGIAIVGYLNTWGILRTGIADFPRWYREMPRVRSLLESRAYSSDELKGFTEAYWSTPADALREVAKAEFEVITYAGVEGFCGGMSLMVAALAQDDPSAYANVVALAVETSQLPQYRDATDHLHVVLRRPHSQTSEIPGSGHEG